MNNESQKAIAPSNARRRLVRGAFSAPALLTLCSGSALAAASLTCRTKAISDQATVPASATVPTTGNWLRVQAYKKNGVYFISGDDVSNLAGTLGGSSYLTRTQWQRVSTSPFNIKEATAFSSLPLVDPGNYVAVKINATGSIVGFSGSTGSGVSNSAMMSIGCWSSIIV